MSIKTAHALCSDNGPLLSTNCNSVNCDKHRSHSTDDHCATLTSVCPTLINVERASDLVSEQACECASVRASKRRTRKWPRSKSITFFISPSPIPLCCFFRSHPLRLIFFHLKKRETNKTVLWKDYITDCLFILVPLHFLPSVTIYTTISFLTISFLTFLIHLF